MGAKRSIYIVDDSTITRLFIIDAIKEIENLEITQLMNGEQLLVKLEELIPDLVILDSVMPIMDGLTALEKIREKKIQVPIIICTADIQSTTKAKAISLGATDFINKPIQKPIIFEVVKRILNE
ncbi:MAG TPA: response regulator [Tenuifilaceae bacterium]|nr:response regulator [Tenuifilaceae bacterium]HPE18984.1 response regulator [Tenuifilaceae bacterium]HPJ44631.1 response regulator [Tenuifilaceae bacterium]HPQ33967.1 response regulator [Tenuifilaceae bacterium]HRX69016.1 response regulator [Tenuifilaceae bacterium]